MGEGRGLENTEGAKAIIEFVQHLTNEMHLGDSTAEVVHDDLRQAYTLIISATAGALEIQLSTQEIEDYPKHPEEVQAKIRGRLLELL